MGCRAMVQSIYQCEGHGNSRQVFVYHGLRRDQLAEWVRGMFAFEGYELERGYPQDGTYGKGSGASRLLFGGFAHRYRFSVVFTEQYGRTESVFAPAMTGLSGGVIGIVDLNREFQRLGQKMETLFLISAIRDRAVPIQTRCACIRLLAGLGDPTGYQELHRIATGDPDAYLRSSAVAAIAPRGGDARETLSDPSERR